MSNDNEANNPIFVTPTLLRATADAACSFYVYHQINHTLNEIEFCDVLLLGDNEGKWLWQLVRALDTAWTNSICNLPNWRIRFACDGVSDRQTLLSHPYLTALFAEGRITFGIEKRTDEDQNTPLVALDINTLSLLPAQACCIHYGQIWQAESLDAKEGQWHQSSHVDVDWQSVLTEYLHGLSHSYLSLPVNAAQQMDELASRCDGRLLWIGVESAVIDLHGLRRHESRTGKLNLHALARYQRQKGISVWQRKWLGDACLHVAWFDGQPTSNHGFAAVIHHLNDTTLSSPISATMMAPLVSALQADCLPELLAISAYDPSFLANLPSQCVKPPSEWHESRLHDWREAIKCCWALYFPVASNADAALRFADLAYAVEDWDMMRNALQIALHWFEPSPNWLQGLATCSAATGDLDLACYWQTQAAALAPACKEITSRLTDLRARHERQTMLAPVVRDKSNAKLRLEPLGLQHTEPLFWQFRDPEIAVMCGLPPLRDENAMRNWIVLQHQLLGRHDFAVLHNNHGLIGMVSYEQRADNAYVSFWLGCDYQGKGYAVPALKLLLAQIEHTGLTRLFTSVYAHNQRSLRSLQKAGFEQLPLPVKPDDSLLYLAWQAKNTLSVGELIVQMNKLCAALDCPQPSLFEMTEPLQQDQFLPCKIAC